MAISDLETSANQVPARVCACCYWLDALDNKASSRLTALLSNPAVRYSELADELATDPDWPTIDWQTLSRHARGKCSAKQKLR